MNLLQNITCLLTEFQTVDFKRRGRNGKHKRESKSSGHLAGKQLPSISSLSVNWFGLARNLRLEGSRTPSPAQLSTAE